MAQRLEGHWRTIVPQLTTRVPADDVPAHEVFRCDVPDERYGSVRITGAHSPLKGASHLVIIIHGLGSNADRDYCLQAAITVRVCGAASLRVSLRGADLSGEDIYHAGLTADIHAVLAHPVVAAYESVCLLGFSLGGHVALKTVTESVPENVRAVATICSPLDIAECQELLDSPSSWLYRRYLLSHLFRIHEAAASRGRSMVPHEQMKAVKKLKEMDSLGVVPRFGFKSPEDYYAKESVGPLLSKVSVPAFLLIGEDDPMVPIASQLPYLENAADCVTHLIVPGGGHVGFPPNLVIGDAEGSTYDQQLIHWLIGH